MSASSEKQLNDHLREAVSAIPSDHAEELWSMPAEKADNSAWYLEGTESKPRNTYRFVRWVGLAAACFAAVLLGWHQIYKVTDATVYLDVNPSITMELNRLGKVTSAVADNEDGRIILDNMDLRGTDVDVAMNALLGSMVKNGYLSQAQNMLLLSVNGRNEARTTALRQKLSINAGQTLEALLGGGVVLGQNVDLDDVAEDIAEHYKVSPGKAALILRLLKDRQSWRVQDLGSMSMTDLIRYCHAAGIDISQYLGKDGEIIGDLDSLLDDDDRDDDDHDDDRDDDDSNDDRDDDDSNDDRDDDDHDDDDDESDEDN